MADRIGERDPGNKPKPNDRIPYVYIKKPDKVVVKETYNKLTNESKFGKYLYIYKNLDVIIIKITSAELTPKEFSKIYLQVLLKWDWDWKKQKGYSIEFISDIPMLYKLLKPRLTKPPILTIKTIQYCKYDLPDKLKDLLEIVKFVTRKTSTSIQNCNITKNNIRIPMFEKLLFHKKEFTIKKSTLQGDKIENPDYVLENNIPINYKEYIEKQIVKPVCQIYGLIIEDLDKQWKFPYEKGYYDKQYKKVFEVKQDVEKTNSKIREMKEKMVKSLLFDPIMNQLEKKKKQTRWNNWGFSI